MSSPPRTSSWCTALHPMVQGITGPEPITVQGPLLQKGKGGESKEQGVSRKQ